MTTEPGPGAEAMLQPRVVYIRLDGQERLRLVGAIGRVQGVTVRYAFYPLTSATGTTGASSQPAASAEQYQLRAIQGQAPGLVCEIRYTGTSTASVTLSTNTALPDIQLLGVTATQMWPCRTLDAGASERGMASSVVQAAIGPVAHGHVNALLDPVAKAVLGIDGQVEYEWGRDGTVLKISLAQPRPSSATVLVVSLRTGLLPGLDGTTLGDEAAPAGWSACGQGAELASEELLRIGRWLATNLKPFGATSLSINREPARDEKAPRALEDMGLSVTTCRSNGTAELPRTHTLPDSVNIERLPVHDPGAPGFEEYRRLRLTYDKLLCAFGGAVFGGRLDPGPIMLAEPQGLEQARAWASLAGLTGVVLMAEGWIDQLPAERVELLRRVCPPAPIRAMDLFDHCGMTQASVWTLRIAAEVGRWDLVGVFNFLPERVTKRLRLAELGITAGGGHRFVVYDFWNEQLLAVTDDGFDVHLEADSCAVLCVRPLADDAPTLIGTSRHLTQAVMDLGHLAYDSQTMTLSGTSDVIADDPYELRVFVGEGDDSFEIVGVECHSATSVVRSSGPVQIVTFEAALTGPLDWSLRFGRTARDLAPPCAPRALSAIQNTRGVLLRWEARDERAVTQRVYRDGRQIAVLAGRARDFQDSDVEYGRSYEYTVSAVDYAGRESHRSGGVNHVTPIPADTHLTQLVPLSVVHGCWPVRVNQGINGGRLRIAGQRYFRGLGTSPGARVTYFLGRGYETFTGEVGIDDETRAKGSAIFEIYADDERLFNSGVMRAGQPARRFNVMVAGKQRLTLVVADAGDGTDGDHADWGDTYLRAAAGPRP